jgi:hypothetical protein
MGDGEALLRSCRFFFRHSAMFLESHQLKRIMIRQLWNLWFVLSVQQLLILLVLPSRKVTKYKIEFPVFITCMRSGMYILFQRFFFFQFKVVAIKIVLIVKISTGYGRDFLPM